MFRIISGGQTGVDRAALDAAINLQISHGGWCPRGRLAEDGTIPDQYHLSETGDIDYRTRTEWNVRDTDATLVLNTGKLEGGTELTIEFARKFRKPCLVINLDDPDKAGIIYEWLLNNRINTLNVAGPRASKRPGIYDAAYALLLDVFSRIQASPQHN